VPVATALTPSSKVAEAKFLLKNPASKDSCWLVKLCRAGGWEYLRLLAVYYVAHSGSWAATLAKSPSTNSWEVQVSP
jgi:hypothetical protein